MWDLRMWDLRKWDLRHRALPLKILLHSSILLKFKTYLKILKQ